MEKVMEWARILAYITGTADQELLLRNEYLATENRILRAQIKDRLYISSRFTTPKIRSVRGGRDRGANCSCTDRI